jgi:hypothetical protein
MTARFRFLGLLLFLIVGGIATSELALAPAQSLNEGWNAFELKYSKVRLLVNGFIRGTEKVDPNDKSHVEALDLHARYYTNGVYLQNLESAPMKIKRNYEEFEGDVDKIKAKDRDMGQSLSEVFRDRVRANALVALKEAKLRPVHKIHNARLLAKVAELGQGELADTFVDLLKDTGQNEGVHFYVLRGMRTLLSLHQPTQMPPVLNKQQEAKAITALVEFLDGRKWPPKDAPADEIEGFRLLRREAVRALAQVHTPTVNDKVRPALVLARFAGDDERIQPPPRLDERIEAAIALARLPSASDKQYRVDYAASQIAKCIGALAQAYIPEKDQKDGRTLPWRVEAAQLNEALTTLKPDAEKNPFVAEVIRRGSSVLTDVMNSKQPNAENMTWLTTSQSDAPSKELFQGVADTAVKRGEAAEAATEK